MLRNLLKLARDIYFLYLSGIQVFVLGQILVFVDFRRISVLLSMLLQIYNILILVF